MVGLLGTVIGMMGAFAKIAGGDKVDPTQLADDISFASITTACGLAIAIPLVLADGDCRHETVVMVLDAGNAVGMENVRLATADDF